MRLSKEQQSATLESLNILCDIFWGPDLEKCRGLLKKEYFQPFGKIDALWEHASPDILENIKGFIQNFSDGASLFSFLEDAYIRIFINARGGIVAPLYQSCYDVGSAQQLNNQPALMGQSAVLMKDRFADKGLSLANDFHEPPDHLCIELEYLFFLLQTGWSTPDDGFISEAVAFAGDCMLPWVTLFQDRLLSESTCPFYPLAAALLASHLNGLAKSGRR